MLCKEIERRKDERKVKRYGRIMRFNIYLIWILEKENREMRRIGVFVKIRDEDFLDLIKE